MNAEKYHVIEDKENQEMEDTENQVTRRHSPSLPLIFAHCSSLPHGQPWEHKHLDFIVASPQLNAGCLGRVKRVLGSEFEPSFPPQVTPDSENDFGNYNCTAVNRIGQESSEFILVQAGEQGGQGMCQQVAEWPCFASWCCWGCRRAFKEAVHGSRVGLELLSISVPLFLRGSFFSVLPERFVRALIFDLCTPNQENPLLAAVMQDLSLRAVPAPGRGSRAATGADLGMVELCIAVPCGRDCGHRVAPRMPLLHCPGCFVLEKGLGVSSPLERRQNEDLCTN